MVVEGPRVGVGAGGAGSQQGRLLVLVEDAVGAVPQKVGRVIEAAQGLPGAGGRPDAFDEVLDPAVTLQITTDRADLPTTRRDHRELLQEPVDEEAAETVAPLPEGTVTGVGLVQEVEDLGLRHTKCRTLR